MADASNEQSSERRAGASVGVPLRDRAARFASLQAAQRGLARSVHPSELAPIREQGRALLIELQAVARQTSGAAGASLSPDAAAALDRALDEQTARTRAVLTQTALPQLRASVPALVIHHREEVVGLVDVLLDGDPIEPAAAPILEYLVTMLATEERLGRRIVVTEAAGVTRRLAALTAEQLERGDEETCLIAERLFESASAQILQGGDVGEIRDRVRRFKDGLGAGLLHPRVLAAAVAYNAAMWNHVASEIDSSRAIDQLAEELFAETGAPASSRVAPTGPETTGPDADPDAHPAGDLLSSAAFDELVGAVRARTRGQAAPNGRAGALAARLALDSLPAEDVEAFDADADDEQHALIQQAIVVGLVLRSREELGDAITDSGLDPAAFDDAFVSDLVGRMTELARKRFASSEYAEAFRISEVKMRSLGEYWSSTPHGADGDARSGRAGDRHRDPDAGAVAPLGRFAQLRRDLFSGPAAAVVLLAAIVFGLIYGPGVIESKPALSGGKDLEAISPLLEWGREADDTYPRRFVGRLSGAWAYVDTPQRHEIVESIGSHYAALDVPSVVLTDRSGEVVAQYAQGQIVLLTPRPSDDDAD